MHACKEDGKQLLMISINSSIEIIIYFLCFVFILSNGLVINFLEVASLKIMIYSSFSVISSYNI